MPWRLQSEPSTKEKILAALCYPTLGLAGLLYLLFARPTSQSQLFRFHFLQSILLGFLTVILSGLAPPLLQFLFAGLQLLDNISSGMAEGSAAFVLWLGRIIQSTFGLLLAYGAIWAFLGKFAEIPFISNVVRQNMRGGY